MPLKLKLRKQKSCTCTVTDKIPRVTCALQIETGGQQNNLRNIDSFYDQPVTCTVTAESPKTYTPQNDIQRHKRSNSGMGTV